MDRCDPGPGLPFNTTVPRVSAFSSLDHRLFHVITDHGDPDPSAHTVFESQHEVMVTRVTGLQIITNYTVKKD
jgi:hypothetical protein